MDVQSDSLRLETPRRLEILTDGGGRRRWSAELKAKIVAESYADDALPIVEIARRYGARGSQVHGWRKQAREGQLALPANTEALNFAPIVVAAPKPPRPRRALPADASAIEIDAAGISVRIRGAVDVKLVEAIVRTLRA